MAHNHFYVNSAFSALISPFFQAHRKEKKMGTMGGRLATAEKIGEMLRRARRRRGMTQVEAGVLAGMPQNVIAALESGKRIPRLDVFARLLAAEGYSVAITLSRGRRRWRTSLG